MKINLVTYRQELQAKLDAVDLLLEGSTPAPKAEASPEAPSVQKARRSMSPEAKEKIAAAARKRWRNARAAGKTSL